MLADDGIKIKLKIHSIQDKAKKVSLDSVPNGYIALFGQLLFAFQSHMVKKNAVVAELTVLTDCLL